MKYGKTLGVNIEQLQLRWKERQLADDETLLGLQGEVLTATGLGWG
jgi:hypothetical protein